MSHGHMNCWFKPDGSEIWLNDRPETEEAAKKMGFVRKILGKKEPPKIRVERNSRDLDE